MGADNRCGLRVQSCKGAANRGWWAQRSVNMRQVSGNTHRKLSAIKLTCLAISRMPVLGDGEPVQLVAWNYPEPRSRVLGLHPQQNWGRYLSLSVTPDTLSNHPLPLGITGLSVRKKKKKESD